MITLRCVIDNQVMRASTLWGEHGVAFLIETPDGHILFDTGQSGKVLIHNAAQMGIDLQRISAIAISHAHYDHTGGLERFLALCRPGIPLFANPDLFRKRYAVKKDGRAQSIGLRLSRAKISERVNLRLSAEPLEILPGIWTTGEITDRSEFERRSLQHHIRENKKWLLDPYRDDLSIVIETHAGLVVVCGCCHAGLLNTLAQIQQTFQKEILAIVGGLHLASADGETLNHVINFIRRKCGMRTPYIYPNHCTGERTYLTMVQAFGEKVQPCPAGTVLTFD